MRFRGGGVGHKSTRDATDFFKNDRDKSDLTVLTPVSESDEEEVEQPDAEIQVELDGLMDSDEERDYGYDLGENSEYDSDLDGSRDSELEEEDFGAEGDGGGIDEDMVALGYSEL